jgi:hypothetical protein
MLDRALHRTTTAALAVTTVLYMPLCTRSSGVRPSRLCKRKDSCDTRRAHRLEQMHRPEETYPRPRNAGTRPAPGTRLKSACFIRGSSTRPLHTRRLAGDRSRFLDSNHLGSQPDRQTRFLLCGTLESRHERLAGADAPRRLHGWTISLVYKYRACREVSSSSYPQPVREGSDADPMCIC